MVEKTDKEMKSTIMKRSHWVLMLTRNWECLKAFLPFEKTLAISCAQTWIWKWFHLCFVPSCSCSYLVWCSYSKKLLMFNRRMNARSTSKYEGSSWLKVLPFIFSITLSGQEHIKLGRKASIHYNIFKDFVDQDIFQKILIVV